MNSVESLIENLAEGFEGDPRYIQENMFLTFAMFSDAQDNMFEFMEKELPLCGYTDAEAEAFRNHLLQHNFITPEGRLTLKAKERNLCLHLE